MRFIRFVLVFGLVGLVVAGVYLLGDERRAASGDGAGYRLALEPPSAMQPGVCPDYRDNAGAKYFWDRHAFTDALEAQRWHCGRIDKGPLGEWIVEEGNDSQGAYSISARLQAQSHTVTYDWGGYAPSISFSCWRGDSANVSGSDEERQAGPFLSVWLWHSGPPQAFLGEPTPVRYRFAGQSPSDVALWLGHVPQPEVVRLLPPAADIPAQEADSLTFAEQLRRAAAENTDENSGPMLEFETWSGVTADALGTSQGTIQFDLIGVERAAFPVLDACGA